MVREILHPCHKEKPHMGILNKSETNSTIQQGQELEINSHIPEQNTPQLDATITLINNSSQFSTFRAIIVPIFRSKRLCVTACGIMHPRSCRPPADKIVGALSCNTQSSAPEEGQNNCPKRVELIGIINKPLLLHLVGCLCYLYQ
jgi:hypothetical protein